MSFVDARNARLKRKIPKVHTPGNNLVRKNSLLSDPEIIPLTEPEPIISVPIINNIVTEQSLTKEKDLKTISKKETLTKENLLLTKEKIDSKTMMKILKCLPDFQRLIEYCAENRNKDIYKTIYRRMHTAKKKHGRADALIVIQAIKEIFEKNLEQLISEDEYY